MRREQPNDDELDRLLALARWTEPTAEQIRRLTAHWNALQVPRRSRRWHLAALAAAASVAFVAALLLRAQYVAKPDVVAQPEHGILAKPTPLKPSDSAVGVEKPLEVRGPKTYELVVLAGHARRRDINETRDDARVSWCHRQVAEMGQALSENPQADLTKQLGFVRKERSRFQRLIWPIARNPSDSRRPGAARLLAIIGTRESLPVLAELAGDALISPGRNYPYQGTRVPMLAPESQGRLHSSTGGMGMDGMSTGGMGGGMFHRSRKNRLRKVSRGVSPVSEA
jgi:hypothetical protein